MLEKILKKKYYWILSIFVICTILITQFNNCSTNIDSSIYSGSYDSSKEKECEDWLYGCETDANQLALTSLNLAQDNNLIKVNGDCYVNTSFVNNKIKVNLISNESILEQNTIDGACNQGSYAFNIDISDINQGTELIVAMELIGVAINGEEYTNSLEGKKSKNIIIQ